MMHLAHPELETVLELEGNFIPTLVIENQSFYRQWMEDFSAQAEGLDGKIALSQDNKLIPIAKNAELVLTPIGFSVNTKALQSKLLAALEKAAVGEQHYLKCMALLQQMEQFVYQLTEDCTADIICGKLSIGAVLKAVGISVNNDYADPLERFLDYMELVREYDRDKLFVFTNLRSFFTDEELGPFLETCMAHEYRILLVESSARDVLPMEHRLTIDADLCEF